MPVYLYTGSPGSGKTYYVVKNVLLDTIREKRLVITNIKLNAEVLTDEEQKYYIYINPLDNNSIADYRTKCFNELHKDDEDPPIMYVPPVGIPFFSLPLDYKYPHVNENGQAPLFVIDECQKILSKSAKPSKSLIEFYQEHRHFSEIDIVLITQGQRYLNETLKELIEETFYLQKARFKGKNKYHVRKYSGLRERGTQPQLNRSETYDLNIFKYYKSQSQSKQEVEREEVNKSSKFVVYLKYFFILMILAGVGISWTTWKSFSEPAAPPPASNSESSQRPLINESTPKNSESPQMTEAQQVGAEQTTDYYEYKNVNFRPSLPEREIVQNSGSVEHAPFFNYKISISAYIQGGKGNDNGFLASFKIYDRENAVYLSQTNKELVNAGYSVTFVNSCLALIDHPREQNPFYVHCESQDKLEKMEDRKI